MDDAGLPQGVTELLHLAFAVPEQKDTGRHKQRGRVSNALALKPIIPFPVRRWLVVTRWTLPISVVPDITTTTGSARGLGDIDMTTWFVPPQQGRWKFGFGVAKGFATATTDKLSTLGWSTGPAALALAFGVQGYYNIVRPDYVGRFALRTKLRLFVQGLQPRCWIKDRVFRSR